MSRIICVALLSLTFVIFIFPHRSSQQRTSMYVVLLFCFTSKMGFSFYLASFIKNAIFISRCYFLQKAVTVSCSGALFDVVKPLEIL